MRAYPCCRYDCPCCTAIEPTLRVMLLERDRRRRTEEQLTRELVLAYARLRALSARLLGREED